MEKITIKEAQEKGYKFVMLRKNRLPLNEVILDIKGNFFTEDGKFEVYNWLKYPILNIDRIVDFLNKGSKIHKFDNDHVIDIIAKMDKPVQYLNDNGFEKFCAMIFLNSF